MNFILLLITLLLISSIGQIHLLKVRVFNRLASCLPTNQTEELKTSKNSDQIKVDNLRILLSGTFLFSTLFLFKSLRKASIEDILIASVLLAIITIISIVGFWFSATKLKEGKFTLGHKNPNTSYSGIPAIDSSEKVKLSSRKIESYKKKKVKKENLKTFEKLLDNLNTFEFWISEFNQFELSNFQTRKGQVMDDNHAWLTLIICFHEEILKTRVKRLTAEYYEVVNRRFLKEEKISKMNWITFRKSYMDNGAIKDLKSSSFYKEIVLFIKKMRKM